MLELKLYMHKKYKDIYLLRIPRFTDKNHIWASDNANKSVDVWLTKYGEDEGYKGTLEKEEELLISDVELVVLREVVCNE